MNINKTCIPWEVRHGGIPTIGIAEDTQKNGTEGKVICICGELEGEHHQESLDDAVRICAALNYFKGIKDIPKPIEP